MRLVLASGSPRRLALLREGGLVPEVVPADIDETPRPGEPPAALVRRLAVGKASAVAGPVVLGADTEVVRDGQVLGKPADEDDARAMLRANAGRVLRVLSGVAVAAGGDVAASVVVSSVRFAQLDEAQVERYVATGEPFDAAGGFRIQGEGAALVAEVTGCWTNIVGLPTCEAARLLEPHGIVLTPDACQPTAAS